MQNYKPFIAVFSHWANQGVAEDDSANLRLKKVVMTAASTIISTLAIIWGGFYVYYDYLLPGSIPLCYALVSFVSMLYFFRTKRFRFFCTSQQIAILVLPFLLMWSLGGFANGSVVMMWAFFAPLTALFFIDLKSAARWMLAFLILLAISALLDPLFASRAQPMMPRLNTLYFFMNTGCVFSLIGLALYYFVKDRENAYAQLQQSEMHIRELMLTDPLTGVANRRHLDNRLSEELARQARHHHPLAIIMTDIDWFKKVNDTYGHAVGDEVLKGFANCLEANIRGSDFLARYGGEEFIILLPDNNAEQATVLAERMRESVKQLHFSNPAIHISASFGVTVTRIDEPMKTILNRVDRAMYTSKTHGRDRVSLLTE